MRWSVLFVQQRSFTCVSLGLNHLKGEAMSYVTAFGCRATDVASFAAEANGYGKEAAIAAGATDVRVSQVAQG